MIPLSFAVGAFAITFCWWVILLKRAAEDIWCECLNGAAKEIR